MNIDIILASYAGLLGLFVGSFLNVLIDRLPIDKDILISRSRCDHCHKPLRWFELIPLVSYVIQGARCRRCHKHLSIKYPLIETFTGVIFAFTAFTMITDWQKMIAYLIIFSSLLVIGFIDVKHYIIPDSMIVTGFIGSLLLVSSFNDLTVRFITGVGAFLFLYAIWYVTKGKGMGFGDVKFAFFLGFSLGFPEIIVAFYAAFLTGALVGIILIVGQLKSLKSKIPFGPFLIAGYCCSLFLTQSVLRFFNL